VIRALLLVVALAGVAQADVWQRAVDGKSIDLAGFEEALALGDEAAKAASSRSVSVTQVRNDLDKAIEQYRLAAKANPRSPEPYFRIGTVLNTFFFECEEPPAPPTCMGRMNPDKAREIVDAWDAFERLAPLDPRINEILLQRAILRTKLVVRSDKSDHGLLEAAMHDYKALVERGDGLMRMSLDGVLGNLAETHMMLGQLDEAVETYINAYRVGGRNTSVIYGLAVALDRSDREDYAMTLIRDQSLLGYEKFKALLEAGAIFFVPIGEDQYYRALIEEAFGNYDDAIIHWKAFIQSGAHPQFHARAKEHLDALLAKKNLRWRPPVPRDPLKGY
jgi:tetratricopeptide (TPR) repeat protein